MDEKLIDTSDNILNNDSLQVLFFLKYSKTITGKTKFQKMIFLGQKEHKLPKRFEFIKYNYGPYSFQLTDCLNALEVLKLIKIQEEYFETSNDFPGRLHIYSLTDKGKKIVTKLKTDFLEESKKIEQIAIKWNTKQLKEIIQYVYSKYM